MQAVSRIPQLTPLSLPHSYTPVLSDATHVQDTHGLPPGLLRILRPDGRPSPPEGARPVGPRPPPAIRPPPSPSNSSNLWHPAVRSRLDPSFPALLPWIPALLPERASPTSVHVLRIYIKQARDKPQNPIIHTTMAHTATTLKPPPP